MRPVDRKLAWKEEKDAQIQRKKIHWQSFGSDASTYVLLSFELGLTMPLHIYQCCNVSSMYAVSEWINEWVRDNILCVTERKIHAKMKSNYILISYLKPPEEKSCLWSRQPEQPKKLRCIKKVYMYLYKKKPDLIHCFIIWACDQNKTFCRTETFNRILIIYHSNLMVWQQRGRRRRRLPIAFDSIRSDSIQLRK